MIRVLIVDDQHLFRDLLAHMLTGFDEIEVVALAEDGQTALELAERLRPDVVLLDLQMPGLSGIEVARKLRGFPTPVRILVLTSSSDETDVTEAVRLGVDGYILKSVGKDELVLAIRSVHSGMAVIHRDVREQVNRSLAGRTGKPAKGQRTFSIDGRSVSLSERDLVIIRMVVEGRSIPEMARTLFLAEGRLRNIITEIIAKVKLHDRTQLAVFALQHKLFDL